MKALFIIPTLDFGGAERQLVQLVNELAARRWNITVAVFCGGGAFEQNLHRRRIRLVDLRKGSRSEMFAFLRRLLSLMAEEKPDVIHGYTRTGNLASLLGRVAHPRARILWGVRDSNMNTRDYRLPFRAAHWLAAALSRFADCIVVNSRAGLEHCASIGYPRAKMVAIPNGIDTDHFSPDASSGRALRESLGMRPDAKLIALVGRYDPMKGHITFLHAMKGLSALLPDVEVKAICLGAGGEPYAQQLRELGTALGVDGAVQWLGQSADVRAVYSAADVVCLPSIYGEGFSNVIGEAMACGRTCVVTDVGDSAAIVGSLGIIVPPGDPDALALGLRQALSDSYRSVARAGAVRRRMTNLFSIDLLADRTQEVMFTPQLGRTAARVTGEDPLSSKS